MADRLRPLDIPEELIAPVPTAQAAKAAEWALTFGAGDTTSLARRQHNTDLATYAKIVQDAQAQAQTQLLVRDKGARDLWAKQQNFKLREEAARAKAQQDEIAQARATELHPLNVQLKTAQINNSGAMAKLQAAEKLKREESTAGFAEHLTQFIQGGGDLRSSDGKAALAVGISTFPNADPAMVSKYGASLFPGEKLSPDELVERVTALHSANPQARITLNEKSGASVTQAPEKPEKDTVLPSLEKERAIHVRMLDRAKRIWSKATDDEVKSDAHADMVESQNALADLESQIRTHREGAAAPAAAPQAPPAAPTASGALIASQADYDALPSGAEFNFNGRRGKKP